MHHGYGETMQCRTHRAWYATWILTRACHLAPITQGTFLQQETHSVHSNRKKLRRA